MDQRIMFNFDVLINEKYFTFSAPAGSAFSDIHAALDRITSEFKELAVEIEKREKEKAASEQPVEPVQTEVAQ